ncbi:hypothetical protein BN2537_11169 [Streptomyces venezuelae]|nr:hypothetical protein BN2537_11169 [Streptomyces venezuelae]
MTTATGADEGGMDSPSFSTGLVTVCSRMRTWSGHRSGGGGQRWQRARAP